MKAPHASMLLKAGYRATEMQQRLGHSRIGITLDIYSHLMPGMEKDAALKYAELVPQWGSKFGSNRFHLGFHTASVDPRLNLLGG